MTDPARERRFHFPSFVLGVVAGLAGAGVALLVLDGACRPEPVPVDGTTPGGAKDGPR